MVKYNLKESDGRLYIPAELRESVVRSNEAKAIGGVGAAVVFDPSSSYDDVVRSLELILEEVKQLSNRREDKEYAD